jgi:hypothetical protein
MKDTVFFVRCDGVAATTNETKVCFRPERLSFSYVLAAKLPKHRKETVSSALPEAEKGGCGRYRILLEKSRCVYY